MVKLKRKSKIKTLIKWKLKYQKEKYYNKKNRETQGSIWILNLFPKTMFFYKVKIIIKQEVKCCCFCFLFFVSFEILEFQPE